MSASRLRESPGRIWTSAAIGWVLFEFGRNPFYLIVVVYIFAPYVAREMAGGGPEGQAVIAANIRNAGIAAAITSPILGGLIDRGGARKPLMAAILAVLAGCACALWFAVPGSDGIGLSATLWLMALSFVAYGYSEVVHNAMLPDAGPPGARPAINGMGLALGNLSGALIFAGLLWFCLIPAAGIRLPGAPVEPIWGLDEAHFEIERVTGPLTALWMLVFIVPFFLYMPDGGRPGRTWAGAAGALFGRGASQGGPIGRATLFLAYIRRLFVEQPRVMTYLVARMIYADGLMVLLTLSAVYLSTFLGWTTLELAAFAIWASLFAALGGLVASRLDRRLGPRNALIAEISTVAVTLVAQLSITQGALFFGLVKTPGELWAAPIFNTAPDLVYLALIGVSACAITAAISSSRYMLAVLSPPERIGEFFGLYAVVGTITVWIGPALVEATTRAFDSQRAGMASTLLLFAAGVWGLTRIDPQAGKVAREP